MKTQIVFTCCRCGKEQIENLKWFNVRKFNYRLLSTHTFPDGKVQNELCNDCYRSLKIWLQNGDEYKVLIDENKQLKKQNDWLNEQRINLQVELRDVKDEAKTCKDFCPKESSDWKEYQEWYKEKHKDDIQ